MTEPIIEFKDDAQAYECLKEWQTRLFLDDWTIRIILVSQSEMILKDCAGENNCQLVNRTALIKIAILGEKERDCIQKICDECTLVHELLHCKYNWLEFDYTKLENAYYDTMEHSLIEQMAKSLIMAKYNLTFDWFKNF